MFDIGFWEMTLIGVVALVVLGPERLPKVAHTVGLWVGKLRAQALNVRAEIEKEINADELREALHRQEQEIHNLQIMMAEAREKAQQAEHHISAEQLASGNAEHPADDTGAKDRQDDESAEPKA